jgi:hypothetical protein
MKMVSGNTVTGFLYKLYLNSLETILNHNIVFFRPRLFRAGRPLSINKENH